MNILLIILVVFIQACIITVVISCVLISRSPRQFFKRVLLNLQPCLPGQGFKYEIAEVINEGNKPEAELILSTVLFGKNIDEKIKYKRYVEPLTKSIKNFNEMPQSHRAIYRVYVAPDIPTSVMNELQELDVEIVKLKNPPTGYELTQARYLPATDDPDKYCLSVDADDLLGADIFDTLDSWKKSKKLFFYRKHTMSLFLPLTAGRIGFAPGAMPNIRTRLGNYNDSSFGCDELFLKAEVWPSVKKSGAYTTKETPATSGWLLILFAFIIANLMLTGLLILKSAKARVKQ